MEAVIKANDEMTIRHQAPLPDVVTAEQAKQAEEVEKPKSIAQMKYELEAHNNLFAKYVDND